MLISTDWIKEFCDLPDMDPKEMGSKFTLGCAEVEEIIVHGEYLEKMSVAEIVSIEKHPEADKLNLVTFNVSEGKQAKVVCGASNVRVGLKTPYAPIGTTLPGGFTLTPKKIRGILSEGMLCSKEELGLADSSEGIMELPDDTKVGQSLLEYFNETKDVLLDIDNKSLTHRPDLWGHYGMAREFACIFGTKLKNTFNSEWMQGLESLQTNEKSPLTIKLDKDCAGISYFGITMENITVGESPDWMKKRLLAVGQRSINNIVDISNYVMQELGSPLHIFDRDLIIGDCINIQNLKTAEKFVTLDEQERDLTSEDTVIRDSEKSLVIAGIMGGENSGVNSKTKSIFIEVANWKAAEIRKTSTRLGLRTDSSMRFEKTLDSQLCLRTLLRTIELVKELCPNAKVVGKIEYDGIDLDSIKELKIPLSAKKVSNILGKKIEESQIIDILTRLDFKVDKQAERLEVTVPSFRATKDISCAEDLIEEIGRIIGYDNIEPSSPFLEVTPVRLTNAQALHRKIRDFLVFRDGMFEVMTYPMVGEKLLDKAGWENKNSDFVLLNSLSNEQDRMRPSLLPSILEKVALNSKNQTDFKIFELGRSYLRQKDVYSKDFSQLIIAQFSKSKSPYLDVVNSIENLLAVCNIPADIVDINPKFENTLIPSTWSGLHPFENQSIRIMGKHSGVLTSIHPLTLRSFKIKGHLSVAIIDLNLIEERPMRDKVKYKSLPKFPNSEFDWTILADKNVQVTSILNISKKLKIKEMISVKIADVFALSEKQNAITLKAVFSSAESTLDGEFLEKSKNSIIQQFEHAGFPLKSN
jgi:phenylalanyl-tRNA synthetase beta chain